MRAYSEGLVIMLLGLVAVLGLWNVPAAGENETWAGIVPFGAGLALLLISGFMLYGARQAVAGGFILLREHGATLQILSLFAIALIYQQSFRWFGYVLPTAIAAPVVLYIFGVRNRLGLALSIVLCPLVYHLIFFKALGVFPPIGEVFDLLDAVRG